MNGKWCYLLKADTHTQFYFVFFSRSQNSWTIYSVYSLQIKQWPKKEGEKVELFALFLACIPKNPKDRIFSANERISPFFSWSADGSVDRWIQSAASGKLSSHIFYIIVPSWISSFFLLRPTADSIQRNLPLFFMVVPSYCAHRHTYIDWSFISSLFIFLPFIICIYSLFIIIIYYIYCQLCSGSPKSEGPPRCPKARKEEQDPPVLALLRDPSPCLLASWRRCLWSTPTGSISLLPSMHHNN
jgi:hypothetical protein